ncbi:MAG TPA: cytochrome c biogenesis protein CcdA, partial [Fimbriimonadaceae bacterium]|nr:cytochrome c biogenesis protein CcdA [Fimbriimonadaceae bacterium]
MHNLPLPLAAFLAGVLSFLSPCVLPLVPGYVSLISGSSVEDLQSSERRVLGTVMLHSVTFVLGFSVVFIALGAVATSVGQLANEYHSLLSKIAGIIVIIFGLHLTGILKIKALYADKRLHDVKGGSSAVGSFAVGFAFAFGWTPCIGPILATILVLAGAQE